MSGDLPAALAEKPCCCFHPPGVHAEGPPAICLLCGWAHPESRLFPPHHDYVPEPELLPVVPKPRPGDPPWDLAQERLDLMFGVTRKGAS